MPNSPIELTRRLYAVLEAGALHELDELFSPDATTVERPNLVRPLGATLTRAEILAGARSGASVMVRQRYDVHSEIRDGDLAIVRLTWTGEVGRDIGPFREGHVLTAHIAQFVETRDGRITKIETFDCFERF